MVIVHRKVNYCTIIRGVKFFPGMNSLSDAEFSKIEKSKAYLSEISCGNMLLSCKHDTVTSEAVESENLKQRAVKLVSEIQSMSVQEATKLIESLNDPYVLKTLIDKDGRKGIQEAVEARKKAIAAQVGSDLKPESKSAPLGDGSNFNDAIKGSIEDLKGEKGHTAIPALKGK
jgi:hypothetical protein